MDRLGSDVRGTKYFPYGAEAVATGNDKDKFGTYFRDSASGLDYADQRYYSSILGRFMTPDPYVASGGAASPKSWNRYGYVEGDPVNHRDPRGLMIDGGGCDEDDDDCNSDQTLVLDRSPDQVGSGGGSGGCWIYALIPVPPTRCAGQFVPLVSVAAAKPERIPLLFQFVGATSARGFNYGAECRDTLFGAFATETFQILDQTGQAFAVGGLTVQEQLTNQVLTIPGTGSFRYNDTAWVSANRPPQSTTTDGKFVDTPFGGCDTTPDVYTLTQQYRVQYNDQWYVLSPTLNIVMAQGLGTLSVTTQYYSFSVTR